MTIDYTSAYPYPNRTLAELRQSLMIRLGFSAQLAYPPAGMPELLNEFLRDAQIQLFERAPSLRNECWFSWTLTAGQRFYALNGNTEAATLATPVITSATPSATGGTIAAGSHGYRLSAINANGETLASTEATATTTGSTSRVILVWPAVTGATGYKVYGRTASAELLIATLGNVLTYTDTGSVTPAGALPTANTTATRSALLDPLHILYAGIERGTQIYPMNRGIPESLLAMTTTSSIPYRFEVRQALEVWPIPTDALSTILIRGVQQIGSFTADTDRLSISEQAVFLMALAGAKEHYGQNASSIWRQLEVYLGKMVHGMHADRRYIPGDNRVREWPMPVGTFR